MLATGSQECQSIITSDVIFTMNRVIHGTKNAETHLHYSLTAIIPDYLKQKILVWFDDIIFQAETVTQLQDCLVAFIKICRHYSIKVHRAKYVLFA